MAGEKSRIIDLGFGNREIIVSQYADKSLGLEVRRDSGLGAFVAVKPEHLLELADFINEIVERPEPPKPVSPVMQDWAEMPVGARFGWANIGRRGQRADNEHVSEPPYEKLSDTTYRSKWADEVRQIAEAEAQHVGLFWKALPPKPTVREQVEALEDGTTFRAHTDGQLREYIKLTPTLIWSKLVKQSLSLGGFSNWPKDTRTVEVVK